MFCKKTFSQYCTFWRSTSSTLILCTNNSTEYIHVDICTFICTFNSWNTLFFPIILAFKRTFAPNFEDIHFKCFWVIVFTSMMWGHSNLDLWRVTAETESVHYWVQVNICAKLEEFPSRRSWDIAFKIKARLGSKTQRLGPQQHLSNVGGMCWGKIRSCVTKVSLSDSWPWIQQVHQKTGSVLSY